MKLEILGYFVMQYLKNINEKVSSLTFINFLYMKLSFTNLRWNAYQANTEHCYFSAVAEVPVVLSE